jgi:hypothetical protein
VTAASKSRSANQKSTRGTPRPKGRRGAFAMKFWAAALILLPAGFAALVILFKPALLTNKASGPAADAYRLGTIVSDNGSMRCVHGTFDNVTGSISATKPSCEATTFTERGEKPVPLGTIHTLSAISDSFRK